MESLLKKASTNHNVNKELIRESPQRGALGGLYVTILLFICFAGLTSCVSLVATYDAKAREQITTVSKSVDKFYLNLLDTTSVENNGRAFQKYTKQYVEIEVELNSLLAQNRVRPLNQNSTRICEITLQFWQKYKETHKKKDSITNAEIMLNQKYMSDLFYCMQVAEEGKKYLNSIPNL